MTMTSRRGSDIYEESKSGDFVVRKRMPPMVQLAALFFVCFTLLYFIAMNVQYLGGGIGAGLAIFAIIGPLCWYTISLNQNYRDMVLAAEFQNALFSAAARLKTRFCMIVKQDGTVFYYDRGFQNVFPEAAHRGGILMLDKILTSKNVAPQEARKLDRALSDNESATIFMELPAEGQGEAQKLVITVDPIERPSRYFILRGRDYIVKQYDRGNAGGSRVANPSFFSTEEGTANLHHILHTLPIGLYVTDPEGHILFMNYTLESWLGYAQNEVVSRQLTLESLVPVQHNPIIEDLLLKDTEGAITLQTKDRKTLNFVLSQEITRDEHGAFVGTIGRVSPYDSLSPLAGAPTVSAPRKSSSSSSF